MSPSLPTAYETAARAAGSLLLPLGWGIAVVLLPAALACYLGAATAITGLAMLSEDGL